MSHWKVCQVMRANPVQVICRRSEAGEAEQSLEKDLGGGGDVGRWQHRHSPGSPGGVTAPITRAASSAYGKFSDLS